PGDRRLACCRELSVSPVVASRVCRSRSGDLPARSATGSAAGGEQAVTLGGGGIRGLTSSGSPVVSDHRGAPGSLWRCFELLLCHCGGIGGAAGGWGSVVSAAGLSEK